MGNLGFAKLSAFVSLFSLSLLRFSLFFWGGVLNKIGIARTRTSLCLSARKAQPGHPGGTRVLGVGCPRQWTPHPGPQQRLGSCQSSGLKPKKCIHEIVSLFFLSAASAFFAYLL